MKRSAYLLLSFCLLVHFPTDLFAQRKSSDSPATFTTNETLSGMTFDSGGNPVAATVYLLERPKPGSYYSLPTTPLQEQSDADGNFRFDALKPGVYSIWAENELETSSKKKLSGRRVKVSPDSEPQPQPLELKLHPGCGYDLRVTDKAGTPIPDAKISFAWTDIARTYRTDAEGKLEIRNLPADNWYFVVGAKGYETTFLKTSEQPQGEVLPLDFALRPGKQLQGRFVDEQGAPVDGATAYVSSRAMAMSPPYAKFTTDAEGSFRIDGLPADQQLQIVARKDGFLTFRETFTATTTKREWILSRRPYGGDALITVVDVDGEPIAQANVLNQGSLSSNIHRIPTNEAGQALIQDLYSSYAGIQIVAKAPGYVSQQISIDAGTKEIPTQTTITLQKGNSVRGRILAPDGTPMANLKVYFDRGENGSLLGGRVMTDKNGHFKLDGLGEKALLTIYTPPKFAPINQIPIRTDLDELMELTLVPAGAIRIRAIDGDSKESIDSFNVRLGFCEAAQPGDPLPSGIRSTLTQQGVNINGATKVFEHDNEVVGTAFKAIVSAEGYESTTIDRMLTQALGAKPVDVELFRPNMADYQTVHGRILDANGEPVVGANVRLLVGRAIPHANMRAPGGAKIRGGWRYYHWGLLSRDDIEGRDQCEQLLKTISNEKGEFTFEKVKRGFPWIELFYFGKGIYAQRYSNLSDDESDGLTDLEFKATRPATLSIDLDLETYKQAHRISLRAVDYVGGENATQLAFSEQSLDVAEKVSFDNLPPGKYHLMLQAKPEPSEGGGYLIKGLATRTIEIREGEDKTFQFE